MKPLSNEDKILHYITYGSPMNQAFLLDAVLKQAYRIVENKDEVRKSMAESFIHPDSWIAAAESAIKHLEMDSK